MTTPLLQNPKKKIIQLEHPTKPLLDRAIFYHRLLLYALIAFGLLVFSLLVGVLGYHFLGKLPRIDSLLNASMILGGMGPVDILQTHGAKVFASLYALYSGMILLSVFGLFMTPLIHRLLHKMHLPTSGK